MLTVPIVCPYLVIDLVLSADIRLYKDLYGGKSSESVRAALRLPRKGEDIVEIHNFPRGENCIELN